MPFSVVSYNILADAYIQPAYYPHVPAALLAPRARVTELLRRLRELSADVLCLQEVELHIFERIETELGPFGYAANYAHKHAKPDGCATFVKKESFAIAETKSLYFHDRDEATEDSGHVALIVTLHGPDGPVVVANTHLKWDQPGAPREQQWGYRQASELIDDVNRFDQSVYARIVCGDFNASSKSEIVSLFRDAGLVDAYGDREWMFTSNSNRKAKRIDYLFHDSSLTCEPMDIPQIANDTVLPSDREPSDHLAIGARFERREH